MTDDLPVEITRNQKRFKIVHAPVSHAAMDIQAAAIDESKVIIQPPLPPKYPSFPVAHDTAFQ